MITKSRYYSARILYLIFIFQVFASASALAATDNQRCAAYKALAADEDLRTAYATAKADFSDAMAGVFAERENFFNLASELYKDIDKPFANRAARFQGTLRHIGLTFEDPKQRPADVTRAARYFNALVSKYGWSPVEIEVIRIHTEYNSLVSLKSRKQVVLSSGETKSIVMKISVDSENGVQIRMVLMPDGPDYNLLREALTWVDFEDQNRVLSKKFADSSGLGISKDSSIFYIRGFDMCVSTSNWFADQHIEQTNLSELPSLNSILNSRSGCDSKR